MTELKTIIDVLMRETEEYMKGGQKDEVFLNKYFTQKELDDTPYDLEEEPITEEIHKKYFNKIKYVEGIKIKKRLY